MLWVECVKTRVATSAMAGVAIWLIAATPSMAQDAPHSTSCEAPATLPAEYGGWQKRRPITAAADESGLAAATLAAGIGADVTLRPTPDVHYPLRPEHPGGSVSSGGLLAILIDRPGTYRVAIGSAAWLDMVRDGQAVASVGHGPGPACSGIRKMVEFALTPGRYLLQIAGNGPAALPVLVTRVP